jgi:hypothetical protein
LEEQRIRLQKEEELARMEQEEEELIHKLKNTQLHQQEGIFLLALICYSTPRFRTSTYCSI